MASPSPKPQPSPLDGGLSPGPSEPPSPPAGAEALTREEVLRRRRRRARRLAGVYRGLYWALAEEVRARHRQYVWDLGRSPLDPEPAPGGGGDAGRRKCAFTGCKVRAMAMATYCHGHILSDPKQALYKGCAFVIKSVQAGQISCGRPILKAATPSLCNVHLQRTQKNIAQAYKKAALNPFPIGKTSPKFSVLVAECIHQIQTKRRESLGAAVHQTGPKDGKVSQPEL